MLVLRNKLPSLPVPHPNDVRVVSITILPYLRIALPLRPSMKIRFRAGVVHAPGGLLAVRGGVPEVPERDVDHETYQPGPGQGHFHHQPARADQEVVLEPEVRVSL